MQLSRSALAKGCSKQQQVVVVTPIAAQVAQYCSFCVIWACRSCHPSCSCSIMHAHPWSWLMRMHTKFSTTYVVHLHACIVHRWQPCLRKAGRIIVYNIYFTTAVLNLILNLVLYIPWCRPTLSHVPPPPARINSRDLLNLVIQ
jgi:hypothetical protein